MSATLTFDRSSPLGGDLVHYGAKSALGMGRRIFVRPERLLDGTQTLVAKIGHFLLPGVDAALGPDKALLGL